MCVCKQEGCSIFFFFFFLCNSPSSSGLKRIKAKEMSVANTLRGFKRVYFKTWLPSSTAEEVNGKVSVRRANTRLILSTYCFILTLSIKKQGRTSNDPPSHVFSCLTLIARSARCSRSSSWEGRRLCTYRDGQVCVCPWQDEFLFCLLKSGYSHREEEPPVHPWASPSRRCEDQVEKSQRGVNDKAAARSSQTPHPDGRNSNSPLTHWKCSGLRKMFSFLRPLSVGLKLISIAD